VTGDAYVGVLLAELHFPANRSLKAKRQPLTSLRDTLQRRYRASFAEVGRQDSWQLAEVLVVLGASSGPSGPGAHRRDRPVSPRSRLRGVTRVPEIGRPGRGSVGLRLLKVNEALREVLSREIAALKDPRIGLSP